MPFAQAERDGGAALPDVGYEVVERLGRAYVDAHLEELLKMLGRGAFDLHDHARPGAGALEVTTPLGARGVE